MEIIAQTDYRDRMEKEVVPFLKEYRKYGFFCPEDNQGEIDNRIKEQILVSKLYYESYRREVPTEDAKGTIVMVHGFSESAEKYVELIYYFFQAGYQVYIMDVRGHGRSARGQEDLSIVHIDRYEHYLSDLKYLVESIVDAADRQRPMYLFGHSMGGGIGAAFMEWYPDIFQSAVLSSPMIRPLTGGIPIGIVQGIASIQVILGKGGSYVVGHHAFQGDETFESSAATSAERYEYYAAKRLSEKKFQTSGASYSWLREAARMSKYVLKKKNCEKIVRKVLVFQAEQDAYVDKAAQEMFVKQVKSAGLVPVAGTKHEIYMSGDSQMQLYVDRILEFLSNEGI